MMVKKDGWITNIDYGYLLAPMMPYTQKTNLCTLFWQFVLGLFIGWPLSILFGVTILTFSIFFGFFVGVRPAILKSDKTDNSFVPIKSLPRIGKNPILPIYIFLPLGTIALIWNLVKPHWSMIKEFWQQFFASNTSLMTTGGVLLSAMTIYFLYKVKDTEPVQLLKEFIAAKKAKVCPIVRIE